MNARVRVEIGDQIARVRMTRAEAHNGVDFEMISALTDAARTLRRERRLRAVILSGDGPSFCAGLDVKNVLGRPAKALLALSTLYSPVRNRFQKVNLIWRQLPMPVIAAIHGNCFGAGIQLALGADFRIATPDARLSVMESKWGLVPDMGGAALLRELVGIDQAKLLTYTGRIVSGEEGHALGLVTQLADDPIAAAEALAAEIATRSPDAVAMGKFLLQRAWHGSESEALAAERRAQRRLVGRANQRVAIARNSGKPDTPYQPGTIRR